MSLTFWSDGLIFGTLHTPSFYNFQYDYLVSGIINSSAYSFLNLDIISTGAFSDEIVLVSQQNSDSMGFIFSLTRSESGSNTLISGHLQDLALHGVFTDVVASGSLIFPGTVTVTASDADKLLQTPPVGMTTSFNYTLNRDGDASTEETVSYTVVGSGSNPANLDGVSGGTITSAPGQSVANLKVTFGDYLSSMQPNAGFTVSVTSPNKHVSSANGNIQGVSSPDITLLRDLAEASYTLNWLPFMQVDGYAWRDGLTLGGLNAAAFQDGNQIVVSFKGTDTLSDFIADTSWLTGSPTQKLSDYFNSAKALLTEVQSRFSGATITLTGHSLGGALAELLSVATGLPAVVFNAPGAAQFENALHITQSSRFFSDLDSNYRMRGDQVSLSGQQIGTMTTLSSPFPDTPLEVLANHGIKLFKKALSPAVFVPQEQSLPTSSFVLTAATLITQTIKQIIFAGVSPSILYAIDPSGSSTFDFVENSTSPTIETVELPAAPGVGSYIISFTSPSGKSSPLIISPNQEISAPTGTTAIHFTALDSSGTPTNLEDSSMIGVRFASVGDLNATMTAKVDNGSPSYRFFDTVYGTHLFTSNASEAVNIILTRPDLVQETNSFGAVAQSETSAERVYRFFNVNNGTHFYTSSATEFAGLTNSSSTNYRSDLMYEPNSSLFEHSVQQAADVAVYRFFDSQHGTQFLTGDQSEYNGLTTPGALTYRPDLSYEGIAFYAPSGNFSV